MAMFSTIREVMITGLAVSKLMETRCAAIKETLVDDMVELSKTIKLPTELDKAREKFWKETNMDDIRSKAIDEAIRISHIVSDDLEKFREKLKDKVPPADNGGTNI